MPSNILVWHRIGIREAKILIDDGGDMNFGLNLYGLTKNLIKKNKN